MCKGVPHGVRKQVARAAELVAFALMFALVPVAALPQSQAANPNSPASTDAAPTPAPALTPAPDTGKGHKDKGDKNDQPAAIQSWLRIEVVGGLDKKPVQQASVYVKFTVVRKVGKDQKFEFDFKTNDDGVARAPDIPQGKILIQIVATGWKSFGQYYDVVQDNQTIHIELERPPRWY
jgi:hypothetical protein